MSFVIELATRYIRIGRLECALERFPIESPSGGLFEVERHASACGATEYNLYAFGRCLQVAW